jgi:hypothetical protein
VVVRGTIEADAGYLGDLDVDGTLTIGATGEITNAGGDFTIDDDGIQLAEYTTGAIGKRGVTWSNSRAQIYGNGLSTNFKGAWVIGKNTVVLAVENNAGTVSEEAVKIGIDDSVLYGFNFMDVLFRIVAQAGMQSAGTVVVTDTTESTSTTTGSLRTSGGVGIAKNLHIGGQLIAPKDIVKFIEGADSPYTVLSNDVTLLVDTSVSAVTLNLPAGTEGRKVTVKHINGTASTEPVTINRASTDTIEGSTSYTINTDKGCVSLVFYSGVWYILSEII